MVRAAARSRKKRDNRRRKVLYRRLGVTTDARVFLRYRKWGRHAEVGERRRYQVLRVCAYTHRLRPRRPLSSFSLVLALYLFFFFFIFSSFSLPSSSSFFSFSFSPFAAPSRVFPLTRFSRSPWVGRSQHRPIRPSFVYLLVFPIYFTVQRERGREKGEPDLSPLNGINKLYYACTSP